MTAGSEIFWDFPKTLACQDAVKAIDLLGRGSIASIAQPVLRHPLRPENPVGVANGASVTVSWDALPECPAGPNSQTLNSFTFWRTTNAVASCTGNMPAASAFEQVGLNISPYDTIASHAPPTANQAYWYALKANWSTGTSGLSAGVCLSANGTIAPVVRGPVAQISVHDTWRLAEAGELGYRDDSLVPDAEVPDDAGERDFSMSPHRTIGQVHITTGLYFYHLDHLGTPRVITDVNGNLVSKHKYLPFGEELSPPRSTNTHEFTGHERDAETGMDYMLARYYGSSFGRLISVDPVLSGSAAVSPQRWNRYTYALNNPILLVDPTGRVVHTTGSGTSQGVQDLEEKVNLNLTVDKDGNLQSETFVGPRTPDQQLVEDAIASGDTVTMNFEGTQNSGVLYAASDGKGTHTVDVTDTARLKEPGNTSSFTAGGVVLHELAEGLAEVSPAVAGGMKPHSYANRFAPGLDSVNKTFYPLDVMGPNVLTGRIEQQIQDGSGMLLATQVQFSPAMPWAQRRTWSSTGPIISVTSRP